MSSNSEEPSNEGPIEKRQRLNSKDPHAENVKMALRKQKYLIGDKWVSKTPRAFGYNAETGQKSPDPNANRTQTRGIWGKGKAKGRPKSPQRKIER